MSDVVKRSNIQDYEELYTFLSAQVLMDIKRFLTRKRLVNNVENIEVEKVLQDSIMRTLRRFQIFDKSEPIRFFGYILLNYDENQDVIDQEIMEQFPTPINITIRAKLIKMITIDSHRYSEVVDRLMQFRVSKAGNYIFNSNDMVNMIDSDVKDFLEDICEPIKNPNDAMTIEIPITILEVDQKYSSAQQFRAMTITTEEVALMMAGDLIEAAIDILKDAPQ